MPTILVVGSLVMFYLSKVKCWVQNCGVFSGIMEFSFYFFNLNKYGKKKFDISWNPQTQKIKNSYKKNCDCLTCLHVSCSKGQRCFLQTIFSQSRVRPILFCLLIFFLFFSQWTFVIHICSLFSTIYIATSSYQGFQKWKREKEGRRKKGKN